MIKKTIISALAFTLALCVCVAANAKNDKAAAKSAPEYSRLERKADRAFIRGNYERAMNINRRAENNLEQGSVQQVRLELKMARLFTLLQQHDNAIEYYSKVHRNADSLLSVEDVCMYIDNLRLVGKPQQAEIVARSYAFRSPYSRNQRYMNILYSLSNRQHYYGVGESDYNVKLYENSTPQPEYWIGSYGGEAFYALSHSTLQDPLKIYYHRTQYFVYDDRTDPAPLQSIPRELQSGPVAFSPDKTMMAATSIDYKFNDRILSIDQLRGPYPTQLFYSVIDAKRGGFSSFNPLFEYVPGYSYAHPSFFNDGRSIIFSSDCPGGYGGMDLYMCHWMDAEQMWGAPVNLGPYVNTEGDEVYPFVNGTRLYFSSNGMQGFGEYDIYHAAFDNNRILSGSMYHYPYPVNSSGNDFGIYIDNNRNMGYFISDRRGADGRDDIYTFNASINSLKSDFSIGVSQQYSAVRGDLNLITGLRNSNVSTLDKSLGMPPVPENGELLLTIYFNFDSSNIEREYLEKLDKLIADSSANRVDGIAVVGYADELGTMVYNQRLSEKRADAVARYMSGNGFKPALSVEGRGQLILSPSEYTGTMHSYDYSGVESRTYLPLADRIRINSKARRVDIYVKSK